MTGHDPFWRAVPCLFVPLLVPLALAGTGCGSGGPSPPPPLDAEGDGNDPGRIDEDPTGGGLFDDDLQPPVGPDALAVASVRPGHGRFSGGTEVVLRGAGFEGALTVLFDDLLVDPADVLALDSHRISVRTPPGEVGPADVEVRREEEVAILPGGFLYDAFYLEPDRGSTGGGTIIEIRGTATTFSANDIVTFGGTQATATDVVGETLIRCTVPPGHDGEVDVRVVGPGGDYLLEDGYLYYNTADPFGGGLGGGPIAGSIDVTVLNWITLEPVADALVLLGTRQDEQRQAITNADGQVTFASRDLTGRQIVTATKAGFGASSFYEFDAAAVTVFLMPLPDPNPGAGAGRPDRLAAMITGELIYLSEVEFGPGPWRIVPDPVSDDEIKVAFVLTSKPNIWTADVDPGEGSVVTEEDTGINGYTYEIVARPAAFAVYAVSGIMNTRTESFVPYAMGVTRNVRAGPGDTVQAVDIEMTIPLDHRIDVNLVDPPARGALGPDRFGVDAYLDLGGEGIIPRSDVYVRTSRGEVGLSLPWQAPFVGNLSDASYLFVGGAWTSTDEVEPYSLVLDGANRNIEDTVDVGPFNCIPRFADPLFGTSLGSDRELAWTCDGGEPAFLYMELWLGATPVWSIFVRGTERRITLPNLAELTGEEQGTGDVTWSAYAITVPGLSFDEVSYRHLRASAWARVAYDSSLFQY